MASMTSNSYIDSPLKLVIGPVLPNSDLLTPAGGAPGGVVSITRKYKQVVEKNMEMCLV